MSWTKEHAREYNRAYRVKNSEKIKASKRKYYLDNKVDIRKMAAENYYKNPEPYKKRASTRRKLKPVECAAAIAKWQKENSGAANHISKKHRASKSRALAKWADLEKIRRVYDAAAKLSKTTGVGYHVDHIVPLQSDLVCGLHVEDNLQVIPAVINCGKQNRYWPGMP